ncbi:tuberoinfundibular peptide of 39 residues [Antechinus flavipes]|uniref:tuberoinfundibular peptide of 39 residues n=1 Tax=Antechinus flavipes TaxID=38775 RepID=UPI002235C482|nr:tuberoinfundibular peptide of 39 residues [Antechinus flavipes]
MRRAAPRSGLHRTGDGELQEPGPRRRGLLLLLLLLLPPGIPGAPGALPPRPESPSSWFPWVPPPASLTLRDWSLQLTGEAGPSRAPGRRPQTEPRPRGPAPSAGPQRRLVVADDAAFRERARLLAALERRRWLNSYMHKLLVVSDAAAD